MALATSQTGEALLSVQVPGGLLATRTHRRLRPWKLWPSPLVVAEMLSELYSPAGTPLWDTLSAQSGCT